MQQDRWDQIQALFDSALELGAEEREGYLAKECAGDQALLKELRALLAADAHSEDLWRRLTPDTTAILPTGIETPHQVGPYLILEQIGAGGMGFIYRARDTRLERFVALKFLPGHLHKAPQARERFLAEARAASRLDHPNICVIHDIGETPDAQLYLTMPFYQGETLDTRIARGRLPEDEAAAIASQVASGLSAAHANGIIHRDIKPSNIMLTHDGGAKILDFGVAKLAGTDMTSAGMSIGTVAYMAPEQLRGEQADARADLWALGVTLYEALTGQRPFPGQHIHEVMKAILLAGSNPTAVPPNSIGTELLAVIRCALQPEPQARYPSAEALLADLARINRPVSQPDGTARRAGGGIGAPRWESSVLDELITAVTPHIGPIAPVLIKRLTNTTRSMSELHQRLADHLPDAASRTAFFQNMQTDSNPLDSPTDVIASAAPTIGVSGAPQLQQIEGILKPMLGPIAGTLIRRQSPNCADLVQLCQMLADYLPNEKDKARFLELTEPLCE